jgi:hypothetical protein
LLRKLSFVLVVLTLMLGISSAAFAQKTTVQRVVVIKTDDVAAYTQMIAKASAIEKRLGIVIPTKVWQATFAGPNTGTVVATLEFPDMNTLADDYTKLNADAEYQAWIADLNKIRTIVSDSIYKELY